MHYRLVYIGFGNVARALARLMAQKREVLENTYSITYSVTGIATGKHDYAVDPGGLDTEQALDRHGPEAERDLELNERHDRHLVVAEPVVG